MKILSFLTLAILCLGLQARGQSNGKIDIRIVNQQQKPSPEALVELLNAKDSSMVQFATTDKNGLAEFKGLQKGNYIAFVPEIGSKNFTSYLFNISNYDEAYDITLLCKVCNEVTIVAQAPTLSTKKASKLG
jgi:hypothetical protein